MTRRGVWLPALIAAVLFGLQAFYAARTDSQTWDEAYAIAAGMRPPRNLTSHVVRLPREEAHFKQRLAVLQSAPGVEDLLLVEEEGTLYLKVDDSTFDAGLLEDALP